MHWAAQFSPASNEMPHFTFQELSVAFMDWQVIAKPSGFCDARVRWRWHSLTLRAVACGLRELQLQEGVNHLVAHRWADLKPLLGGRRKSQDGPHAASRNRSRALKSGAQCHDL